MKAAYFKNKQIQLLEVPSPKPQAGYALVRVLMAGICKTDLELFEGYYDFEGIAGHEFVGVVEEAPSAPELVGKRVAADINIGCGSCWFCLRGNERHCLSRRVLGIKNYNGAFAEFVSVPVGNIHVVDDLVSDVEAVFIEPLAAAAEISQQVHIKNSDRVGIIGDGKLAFLIAQVLREYNSGLVVVGKHAEKLEVLKGMGIRTHLLDTRDFGSVGTFQSNIKNIVSTFDFFDIMVEATGSASGIAMAIDLVRPEGTIVAKTTIHDTIPVDFAKVVVNELTIIGSRCGDFDLAHQLLVRKRIDVRPLIDKKFPFRQFEEAFIYARDNASGKVIIEF